MPKDNQNQIEKICKTCGINKHIDSYYFNRSKNYYFSDCRSCNLAKVVPYQNSKYTPEKGKRAYLNRKKDGLHIKNVNDMAKKYPEKIKARVNLRDAVRVGKVAKLPCQVCGNPKSQGHHTDYSKPLDVTWVCQKHHSELHRKYNPKSVTELLSSPTEEENGWEERDNVNIYISTLIGTLQAFDVSTNRAVKICQDTESFIYKEISQAYERGVREERERIREYVINYYNMHEDWKDTKGHEQYAEGGAVTCRDILEVINKDGITA